MTTNYERIKQMSIEEMAALFKQKQCEECYIPFDWKDCQQLKCWVKGNIYQQWLESEADNDNN